MIRLGVADGRFDRLAPLRPTLLQRREAREEAPVDDLHAGVECVEAAVARIDDHRLHRGAQALAHIAHLLELFVQRVAVARAAREAARAHQKAALVRDGDAHLHAELVERYFRLCANVSILTLSKSFAKPRTSSASRSSIMPSST